MLVSVIMGIYNAESSVVAAVNSIFYQTHQDIELIVCDDGSTDSTLLQLSGCKKRYGERLIILHNEENVGLSATLNRCVQVAHGALIARMDGDDESLPLRLEHQIAYLQTHCDIAFVGCNAIRFNEKGEHGVLRTPERPTAIDLCLKNCFVHPSIVIRTEALICVGGYSEKGYTTRCEDYDLWFRLYAIGYRGANLQECLFRYYEGDQNLVKRKYRYRFCEAAVRFCGMKANHLPIYMYVYAVRPLLVGLIPSRMLSFAKAIKRKSPQNYC